MNVVEEGGEKAKKDQFDSKQKNRSTSEKNKNNVCRKDEHKPGFFFITVGRNRERHPPKDRGKKMEDFVWFTRIHFPVAVGPSSRLPFLSVLAPD